MSAPAARAAGLAVAGLTMLCGARASGGAWTREAGHGYVGTGWSRIAATKVFARDYRTAPIAPYEQNAWNLYGELGLVSRWLTATVAADGVIQEGEAELLRAIADTLDCPVPPFVQLQEASAPALAED